ncbi:hypothetical protein UF75_2960 [Desulfosporosinus sp. I2]|nr:hypothetical protein UF75_2960 [Desulfosporosinus sp. I2]
MERTKQKLKRGMLMKWVILFIVVAALVLLFNHGAHKDRG